MRGHCIARCGSDYMGIIKKYIFSYKLFREFENSKIKSLFKAFAIELSSRVKISNKYWR